MVIFFLYGVNVEQFNIIPVDDVANTIKIVE